MDATIAIMHDKINTLKGVRQGHRGEESLRKLAYDMVSSEGRQAHRTGTHVKFFGQGSWLLAAAVVTRVNNRRAHYLRDCRYRFDQSIVREPGARSMARFLRGRSAALFELVERALRSDVEARNTLRQYPELFLSDRTVYQGVSNNNFTLDYGEAPNVVIPPPRPKRCRPAAEPTEPPTVKKEFDANNANQTVPNLCLDSTSMKRRKTNHCSDPVAAEAIIPQSEFDRASALANQSRQFVSKMLPNYA